MAPADLQPLFELEPERILLGSGETQAFPPAETMAACLSQGIGLETMTHAAAARTFNVLAGEGRKVVAGFVLGASAKGPPSDLPKPHGPLRHRPGSYAPRSPRLPSLRIPKFTHPPAATPPPPP